MVRRRVLLYGGCHALVLRDLLASHFPEDVSCTLLVNFELIRSGRPFPYETLRQFDFVLYSPIENKGEYNTIHLVEACRALRIEAICYPWLEWHGYCPGASKAEFKRRFQWRYEGLAEAASAFPTFEDYLDWAIESYPSDTTIATSLRDSTAIVQAAERRHAMPVQISDFIIERHRSSRLFLISDHPSLALYLHVLAQMLKAMGIDGALRCARIERDGVEPQWQWRTPIFPRVARQLELQFSDTGWVDDEIVPGRCLDLRTYLLLYYHANSLVLGPTADAADIAPATRQAETATCVRQDTRLLANQIEADAHGCRDQYRLLGVLSGAMPPTTADQRFTIDARHWRSSWG